MSLSSEYNYMGCKRMGIMYSRETKAKAEIMLQQDECSESLDLISLEHPQL